MLPRGFGPRGFGVNAMSLQPANELTIKLSTLIDDQELRTSMKRTPMPGQFPRHMVGSPAPQENGHVKRCSRSRINYRERNKELVLVIVDVLQITMEFFSKNGCSDLCLLL